MSATSFFDLPFEIKIHILKDVDILSLMQLCELYPSLKECMKEKKINEYFVLSGLYDLNSDHFRASALAATFRMESITVLNINSVYWIARKVWNSFLSKLTNLKCLYAIDTTLRLDETAKSAYENLNKLEILAITIDKQHLSIPFLMALSNKLIKLYLYVTFLSWESLVLITLQLLNNLKEMWLMTPSGLPIEYDIRHFPLHVTKYTLNVCCIQAFEQRNKQILTHCSQSSQLTFVKTCENSYLNIYNKDTKYDNLFDNLVGTYCYPFCRKDSEQMVLKSILPSNMNLTELNFKHRICYGAKLTATVRKILVSDNTKLVKKLAINFCLCKQSIKKSSDDAYQPLFKKQRLGVPNKGFTKSILEEAVDNMTLLQQLEIWKCISTETTNMVTNNSLSCIQNINRLEKLTLHTVPVHVDGQFLIPIAQNCKKLGSLKLTSTRNLNIALCNALKYMSNLKDLVFEQADMHLQEFFATVVENKNLKLNRICFQFEAMILHDTSILDTFIATNNQLIFLGLIFPASNSQRKQFNKIFNKYKLPKQVFLVTHKVSSVELRIPIVHATQMVNYSAEVCNIDIFNDFIS